MDNRGGSVFGVVLMLIFVCLALTLLVEAPQGETVTPFKEKTAVVATILPETGGSLLASGAQVALFERLTGKQTQVLPLKQLANKDRNGVPLTHATYQRAAYVKFPPEASRG